MATIIINSPPKKDEDPTEAAIVRMKIYLSYLVSTLLS